jgi:FkbM family methyltransferase
MSEVNNIEKIMTRLLLDNPRVPVFAIGRNHETINLNKAIPLDGILDDSFVADAAWKGIRVLKPELIPSDSVIVNCSTSIAPVSAEKRILSLHPHISIIKYSELSDANQLIFPHPSFVQEMQTDWKNNRLEWDGIRKILSDQESKKVFDDVVKYRLSGDYSIMGDYFVRLNEQYFDPVCELEAGEVFVDCGGFDGDTTEQFCERCPEYGQVWLFEPSPLNMAKAKERLASRRNVHFIQEGLSDLEGHLQFNPDSGSASSVSESGDVRIPVTTIDARVPNPVTLIKMDLEGWENKALAGAEKCIRDSHPKLAITVYHKASDFWKIPALVLRIRKDYSLYLRHYTEGWSETVMYFIPQKK